MKLTIEFDQYEKKLLRKARADLVRMYRAQGKPAPSLSEVARGAVRLGIHHMYGEDFVANDLLDDRELDHLVGNDSSLSDDEDL